LKNASTFLNFFKKFFEEVRKALFYAGFGNKKFLKKVFGRCLKRKKGRIFVCWGKKRKCCERHNTFRNDMV